MHPTWVKSIRTTEGVELVKNDISAFAPLSTTRVWSYCTLCVALLVGGVCFYRKYRAEPADAT